METDGFSISFIIFSFLRFRLVQSRLARTVISDYSWYDLGGTWCMNGCQGVFINQILNYAYVKSSDLFVEW